MVQRSILRLFQRRPVNCGRILAKCSPQMSLMQQPLASVQVWSSDRRKARGKEVIDNKGAGSPSLETRAGGKMIEAGRGLCRTSRGESPTLLPTCYRPVRRRNNTALPYQHTRR